MEFEGGKSESEIKLINNGAYGCIFRPGINCKGNKERKNFVTKIQKRSKTIQNEIDISDKVRHIKGYMKYYAPILKSCPVKVSKKYQHEINKCEIFQKDREENKSVYISNKIRYAGSLTLEDYLISVMNKNATFYPFWTSYSYLLDAVTLLFKNDIIHYDLRYNNVMFDSRLDVPIIIDFGLSIDMTKLGPTTYSKSFYVYDFYSYWCMDIMICNYIFQVVTYERSLKTAVTADHLELIFKNFIYGVEDKNTEGAQSIRNGIFNLEIMQNTVAEFKETYFKYLSFFIGKTWFELYTELMKYSNTWDNYSLAVIYVFILNEQYQRNSKLYTKIMSKEGDSLSAFIRILKQILFSPPNERLTPKNARIEMKQKRLL